MQSVWLHIETLLPLLQLCQSSRVLKNTIDSECVSTDSGAIPVQGVQVVSHCRASPAVSAVMRQLLLPPKCDSHTQESPDDKTDGERKH